MPTTASSARVLSSQHRSSFATDQWPSPPCSHRPSQGCAPPPQPKDATSPRQAAPSAPDTCPRLPSHHSYPKGDEVLQSVQVIFARLLSGRRRFPPPWNRLFASERADVHPHLCRSAAPLQRHRLS